MSDLVELSVNGRKIRADARATVAAALLNAGEVAFRGTPKGDARMPLCGMGICYECRVTIDGEEHRRSCMTLVRAGMNIQTGAPR